MSEEKYSDLIHISEIDEYLAVRLIEKGGGALGLYVQKSGDEGYVELADTEVYSQEDRRAIDFELSPSEYLNLEDSELDELLASSLVTSSALELFDFLLLRMNSFRLSAEFTGCAWKIRVKTT